MVAGDTWLQVTYGCRLHMVAGLTPLTYFLICLLTDVYHLQAVRLLLRAR